MADFGTPHFGGGFDLMFNLVPIIIVIGFVVVIVSIAMNGARYLQNANAPKETVYARVVAKRMDVRRHTSHHHHHGDNMHPVTSTRTDYYITLEFEDGQRKEYLDVKKLYGLVVEGDTGYAAVQGDWIVAFERNGGQTNVY